MTFLGSGNIIYFILIGGSTQYLYGLIRALQYINILALVNCMYPANAYLMLQITNEISGIDLFQGEQIHQKYMKFKDTNPLSFNFEAFGIDNKIFVLNSGSLIFFVIFMNLYAAACLIINRICKLFYKTNCGRKIGMFVYQNNLKLQILIFAMEGYLDYVFAGMLQF